MMKSLASLFADPKINSFAKTLAEGVARRYPPALDKEPGKRPSVNRMTRIIEDACKQAVEFKSASRLGWLGKARFSNAFHWELVELGYQKDFVDMATEAIVVHMSRKSEVQ